MAHRSFFRFPVVVGLLAVGAAGTASSVAVADDSGPNPATAHAYQRLLEKYDANHDGVLQVAELPEGMRGHLGRADTDHDGAISLAELHAFGVARRAARFAKADVNHDGKLTPAEVGTARWEYLKVADANGDGAVTLDEIERAVASGALHRPDEAGDEH